MMCTGALSSRSAIEAVVRENARCVNRRVARSLVPAEIRCTKENAHQMAGVFPGGPAHRRRYLALGGIPGDARDIRPGDADIGQLAVAQRIEFTQIGVEAAPGAEGSDDGR